MVNFGESRPLVMQGIDFKIQDDILIGILMRHSSYLLPCRNTTRKIVAVVLLLFGVCFYAGVCVVKAERMPCVEFIF